MSGVCDDTFGARESGPLFNLAMQTCVNEITTTRHMDMHFIEFVEALARIADKAINNNTVEFPLEKGTGGMGGKETAGAINKSMTLKKK